MQPELEAFNSKLVLEVYVFYCKDLKWLCHAAPLSRPDAHEPPSEPATEGMSIPGEFHYLVWGTTGWLGVTTRETFNQVLASAGERDGVGSRDLSTIYWQKKEKRFLIGRRAL